MNKNKPVTPERAIQILAKHNVKVTREQAEKILEFMNKFAQIAIDVYVKSDITNAEHQKK
jgi:hypothetical protein